MDVVVELVFPMKSSLPPGIQLDSEESIRVFDAIRLAEEAMTFRDYKTTSTMLWNEQNSTLKRSDRLCALQQLGKPGVMVDQHRSQAGITVDHGQVDDAQKMECMAFVDEKRSLFVVLLKKSKTESGDVRWKVRINAMEATIHRLKIEAGSLLLNLQVKLEEKRLGFITQTSMKERDLNHRRLGNIGELSRRSTVLNVLAQQDWRTADSARHLASSHYQQLDKWHGCFPAGDTDVQLMHIGIGIGSRLLDTLSQASGVAHQRVQTSASESQPVLQQPVVLEFLESIIAKANTILIRQLNIALVVDSILLHDSNGCEGDIYDHFARFQDTPKPSQLAFWHLIDDCRKDQRESGAAPTGGLCQGSQHQGACALTYYLDGEGVETWRTFLHETGHLLGATHSFEDGVGTTGGIMDYGTQLFLGQFQFNSLHRKEQVCEALTEAKQFHCAASIFHAASVFDHHPVIHPELSASCGNGVIEDGEECECAEGLLSCKCCTGCKFPAEAQCNPFGPEEVVSGAGASCCTEDCRFQPTSQVCELDLGDEVGFCLNGNCVNPCESYNPTLGGFCGVQADNTCLFKCEYWGYCMDLSGWSFSGRRDINFVENGAICEKQLDDGSSGNGTCFDGLCLLPEEQLPTTFPSPFPTLEAQATDYQTPFPATESAMFSVSPEFNASPEALRSQAKEGSDSDFFIGASAFIIIVTMVFNCLFLMSCSRKYAEKRKLRKHRSKRAESHHSSEDCRNDIPDTKRVVFQQSKKFTKFHSFSSSSDSCIAQQKEFQKQLKHQPTPQKSLLSHHSFKPLTEASSRIQEVQKREKLIRSSSVNGSSLGLSGQPFNQKYCLPVYTTSFTSTPGGDRQGEVPEKNATVSEANRYSQPAKQIFKSSSFSTAAEKVYRQPIYLEKRTNASFSW